MSIAPANHNILFVDDDPMVLAALRRAMRKEDFRINFAESGADALRIIETTNISVIVSDMRMPQMSGAELLAEVRRRNPDIISILLTGQADLSDTITAINSGGIYRFLTKPWDDLQLKAAILSAIEIRDTKAERDRLLSLTRRQNQLLAKMNKGLSAKIDQNTAELEQSLMMVDASYNAMRESVHSFVRLFSQMSESRNGMVSGIADQASRLGVLIAKQLKLGEETQQAIEHGILLHEIGKIMMPERLISKPENALSKIELELYRQYPISGHHMLMAIDYLHSAANIVHQHREHWMGNGFPERLTGKDIHIGARVAAIAIAYYALLSGTRTGTAMSDEEVKKEILRQSERQFDPQICEVLEPALALMSAQSAEIENNRYAVNQLQEGDVLLRDLLSVDGFMLVTAGTTLSESNIDRLRELDDEHQGNYIVYAKRPSPDEDEIEEGEKAE